MNAPDRLLPDMKAEPNPPSSTDEHWRELIGQIGSDVGLALSSALERVTTLAATGKIDRAGLRALREEIEHARRVGMIGQQLARFASGRIKQSPEQVTLTQVVRDVLVQRGREATARGLEIRQALRPAEVMVDATLLHALIQGIVDWALEHSQGAIEFRIDLKPWPPNARLSCHFMHRAEAPLDAAVVARSDDAPSLDTMTWRLVEQISWTLGLLIERLDNSDTTSLTLEFPKTIHEQIEGVTATEIDQGFGTSDNSKPLAGSQVLVLAARRDLRSDIREATRHMGLVVDFVSSVEEAEIFCRDALPHAIIFESALANARFERLRDSLLAEVASFTFIEIAEEGHGFELSGDGDKHLATVGREAVLQSLPSALIFELSRTM
jgi:hypothetical protein